MEILEKRISDEHINKENGDLIPYIAIAIGEAVGLMVFKLPIVGGLTGGVLGSLYSLNR